MIKKLLILIFCLLPLSIQAGDIYGSFLGSNFEGSPDESLIFESDMRTDSSGNLIDLSGENRVESSEDLTSLWTVVQASVVGTSILHEDSTAAANHHIKTTNNVLLANTRMGVDFEARAIGRHWVRLEYGGGNTRCDIDLDTCVAKIKDNTGGDAVVTGHWQPGGWCQVRLKSTHFAGFNAQIYFYIEEAYNDIAFDGLDIDSIELRRVRVYEVNEWPVGGYHTTTGAAKPRFNMAPAGSITNVKSSLQRSDGNLHKAKLGNGVDSEYEVAHNAYFDVYDSDHTITLIYMQEGGHAGSNHQVYNQDIYQLSGFRIQSSAATGKLQVFYWNNGGQLELQTTVSPVMDAYHIVQIVRNNNTAYLYIDGVLIDSGDATGYGVDGNNVLKFMAGTANFLYGSLGCVRLRNRALSDEEREIEYGQLSATLINTPRGPKLPTFTRSTTATMKSSTGGIVTVAPNMPRVGGDDGGLLIESGVTQLHGETAAMDNWPVTGAASATPNVSIAPNGKLEVDRVTNVGGNPLNDQLYLITANLGDLTARTFTTSFWARADTPHIATVQLYESGVGATTYDFYATTGLQRFDFPATMTGGGAGTVYIAIFPGQRGVATGIVDFWEVNLTETSFAVSGIPNPGAAASQVTKAADNAYLPIADFTPESICATCQASKIKISFRAKTHWSGSADLDTFRYFLSVANSGLPNYIYVRAQNTTGLFYTSITDSAGVTHSISSGNDPVDYAKWHYYEIFFDTANLANSYQKIDGVDTGAALVDMTGTCTLNLRGSLPVYLRYGTNWSGSTVTRLMGRIKDPVFSWE